MANQITINSPSAAGKVALTALLNDAVANAPAGYTNVSTMDGTTGAGVIVSTNPATLAVLAGGTIANSVILVVTNGRASGAATWVVGATPTKYAIWGRLSTGSYFCIDSTGNTKASSAAVLAPATTATDVACHI